MRCLLILFGLLIYGELLKADPSSSSRIAAVVNNNIITKADLMNRLRFATINAGLEPSPANLDRIKSQLLHVMIDEQLQRNIGKLYGIEVSNDHIASAIADIEENNEMQPGAIKKLMQDNNIPYKTFEDQIKAQLIWLVFIQEKYPLKSLEDQVGRKHTQGVLPSLQIADWEINQEIKLHKEKETKAQYHLAEIVLPFDGPEQEENIRQTLNKLIEELEKGAHFSALAQQFSQSATAAEGGDMGWLTEDQLEPEVKEVLSHLHPGQLSIPIRTSQGYVIIAFIEQKLPGADGNTRLTLQQVMFPFPPNVSEEKAREVMEMAEEISRSAKSCPDLAKMAKEKFPSAASHLSHNEPLSNFAEPLQKIIYSLDIHQGSEPLLSQDGGLVVMVCDRKSQKEKTLTREEAQSLIAVRKHALLARRELRDLRRHAFIDLRM